MSELYKYWEVIPSKGYNYIGRDSYDPLFRGVRSIGGVKDGEVHLRDIVLDIDEPSIFDENQLKGLSYEVWDSGNRGIHIHIPCHSWFDVEKSFHVLKAFSFINGIDKTVLSPNKGVRTPLTIHPKTLKRKKFLYEHSDVCHETRLLEIIESYVPEEKEFGEYYWSTTLWNKYKNGVGEGDRNNTAFILSHVLFHRIYKATEDTSYSKQRAWELILRWNSKNRPPLDLYELEKACRILFT